MGEIEQNVGFDESESLASEDVVELQTADGDVLHCIVLAIVEHEGQSYAILTERGTEDEDLLVTAYDESDSGEASFRPIADDSVLVALQDALSDLLPVTAPATQMSYGPPAEA